MQTLWHEVLHAITMSLHIDDKISDEHQLVDLLATGINSVVTDNDWIKYKVKE